MPEPQAAVAGEARHEPEAAALDTTLSPAPRTPPPPESPEAPLAKADRFGVYRVDRLLGEGGMGRVYLAQDTSLNRPVALKTVSAELAGDATLVKRFRREAQSIAALNHPNIVQVYSLGDHDGVPYFAMEMVEGESLQEVLERRGPLPEEEAFDLLEQCVLALQAAASRDLVHRDVKPSNILIATGGRVKVTDFGLARPFRADSSLTADGIIVGTPHYISPEQALGKPVDPRSDMYSLGATFYHVLCGFPPFEDPSAMAIIMKHCRDPLPPLASRRPGLCPDATRLIERLLAKEPDQRFPDHAALLAAIRVVRAGLAARSRGSAWAQSIGDIKCILRHPLVSAAQMPVGGGWGTPAARLALVFAIGGVQSSIFGLGNPAGDLLRGFALAATGTLITRVLTAVARFRSTTEGCFRAVSLSLTPYILGGAKLRKLTFFYFLFLYVLSLRRLRNASSPSSSSPE